MADAKVSNWRSAIVVALGAMTLLLLQEPTPRTRLSVSPLVEAADKLPTRSTEGRLSGGFAHREVAAKPRGESSSQWKLAAAAGSLDESDAHARGVALLLMDDEDRSVRTLEEAARHDPKNPLVLNDLSVAYFARAKTHAYIPDYTAALDTAEHAWCLRHTPEIAWNRALTLSAFHLTSAAERAWNDYLPLDAAAPGWRREALQRRATLRQGIVDPAAERSDSRPLAEFDRLLPQWARARLVSDEGTAADASRAAHGIAVALAKQGEALPHDAMEAIRRACKDAQACRAIARAHVLYADGLQSIANQGYSQAKPLFSQAAATFARFGSPFAEAAAFRHAVCLIHENRFPEARTAAASLRASVQGKHYRTLQAHIEWLSGLAMLHDARPEESIAFYRAAHEGFMQAHDLKNIAAVDTRLADAFEYAGDRDTAMAHRMAAFEAMHSSGDTSSLNITLFEAGSSAVQRGWPYAGDLFLAESVRQSVAQAQPAVAAVSAMWRSMALSRRGDFSSAAEQARMAATYSNETADPGQRALLSATSKQFGTSSETRSPDEEISDTILFVRSTGNRAWLPELLRQRALLFLNEHKLSEAETDFREAIDISERTLDEAAPATMRDSFTADVRANYEDLIGLLLDRHAWREALGYAERARLIGQGHAANAGHDVLAPAALMAPGTAAAVFEEHSGVLTVWLVTRTSISVFRTHEAKELGRRLASVENAPASDTLSELYDVLVRNWVTSVAPGSKLVFVPPPALEGIPFPALLDRRTGRFLIDDYVISVAPTLASASGAPVTVSSGDPLLIVGDPTYQQMPRLPRSRQEADAVARRYSRVTILLDDEATPANVLREIGRAEVFHFAGHAVINDLAPEMSSLILAADHGVDTHLYLYELLPRHLPLKLAVLSACSTTRRRAGATPGTLNLARALVDRGTRAVVGTLHPIADDDAAAFSIDFHDALNRGQTVAEAVRSAQLKMKSRAAGNLKWATFCLMIGQGES